MEPADGGAAGVAAGAAVVAVEAPVAGAFLVVARFLAGAFLAAAFFLAGAFLAAFLAAYFIGSFSLTSKFCSDSERNHDVIHI